MKSDLTLRTAIEMARHCELIKTQNTEGGKGAEHVDNIKSVRKTEQKRTGNVAKINKKTRNGAAGDVGEIMLTVSNVLQKEKKYMKCNKTGHFAAACSSKTAVQEITEADEDDTMFLGSVELKQSKDALLAEDEPPWRTTLTLADTPVSFKIDSGSDTSVMSEAAYETLWNKL